MSLFLHLKDILLNSIFITCLVMIMLLLVEFINVCSAGKWIKKIENRPYLQVLVAAFLGLVPGCIGGFAVVSLFTHELISFGALLAGLISGFGDEVFVLFAYNPEKTAIVAFVLIITAIISGSIITFFYKTKHLQVHRFSIHDDDSHNHFDKNIFSIKNIKNVTIPRLVLILGLVIYLVLLFSGFFQHDHSFLPFLNTHKHKHISWETYLFAILAITTFIIILFTSNHFLEIHLWKHVIKQHFLSVFLWTFVVLAVIAIILHFVDINAILSENRWALWIILLIALAVGIIPESGPHIIFIILFFNGTIPFSILLANFIVQEGHSALPLLAESRKFFILIKAIKIAIGGIVGAAGLFLNF